LVRRGASIARYRREFNRRRAGAWEPADSWTFAFYCCHVSRSDRFIAFAVRS